MRPTFWIEACSEGMDDAVAVMAAGKEQAINTISLRLAREDIATRVQAFTVVPRLFTQASYMRAYD